MEREQAIAIFQQKGREIRELFPDILDQKDAWQAERTLRQTNGESTEYQTAWNALAPNREGYLARKTNHEAIRAQKATQSQVSEQSPARALAVVPTPRKDTFKRPPIAIRTLGLNPADRDDYKVYIVPFVNDVRVSYEPIRERREAIKTLKKEEKQLRTDGTKTASVPTEVPASDFRTIRETREMLEETISDETKRPTFRRRVNALKTAVNQWVSKKAVEKGIVPAEAAGLVGNPPTTVPDRLGGFRQPASPPLPHNDLGEMIVYRPQEFVSPHRAIVLDESRRRWPDNVNMAQIAISVLRVAPKHIVEPVTRSTPVEFHNSRRLAEGVTDLTQIVMDYQQGTITLPTAGELGMKSAEQTGHITRFVRGVFSYYFLEELRNPHETEDQTRKRYQEMCNELRRAARWIGPNGYKQISDVIDDLPDLEQAMITSRLSTNLEQDLSFPGAAFASEQRIAEVMRNAGNATFRHQQGVFLKEGYNYLVPIVMESLQERMEQGDVDCKKLFGYLEQLDYGEYVIEKLFAALDDTCRDTLMEGLQISGCFRDLQRTLRRDQFVFPGSDLVEEVSIDLTDVLKELDT